MAFIYDTLKNLVNQDMISGIADSIQEKESKVSSAATAVIPGLLGLLTKTGVTPPVHNALMEAGKNNISEDINRIFSGNASVEQQRIGDRFLQALMGDKVTDFTSAISTEADISFANARKIIFMLAPVVAGFLGKRMVDENKTTAELIDEINNEKGCFIGFIPSTINNIFNISNRPKVKSYIPEVEKEMATPTKHNWVPWLIIGLLLVGIIFWWRSCHKEEKEKEFINPYVTTDTIPPFHEEEYLPDTKATTELHLSDNVTLHAYPYGIEYQMISFLESDFYKEATEEDLKNNWFTFDNVEFVHGSGTELMPGSELQIDNIIQILKHFPGTHIKIGGYTDRTGNDEENKKLSLDRASTIKNLLVKGGIPANTISIEGYGEEFAVYDTDAPDEERAKDRIIALRFMK
ncbi:MAG: OmpA family protein [Candidatus Azobacteroides sp.]|nr:OmpA family protein [Candidatus Azobacteroides sp.]